MGGKHGGVADMTGKVVVITGGNSGIGREAAAELAGAGATVVITARDRRRGDEALADIRRRSGRDDAAVVPLDLASLASVRAAAAEIVERWDRLDVLVLNAGAIIGTRRLTEDGFEMTFGVNHLGHFLLTSLLTDRLVASAPSRVVVVASVAHRGARGGLRWDDLMSERGYTGQGVYNRSKLANILFARELARRLDGTGVTVNALHPGSVRSDFGHGGDTGRFYDTMLTLGRPFLISPRRGAGTIVWLASSPEVADTTGGYFVRRRPGRLSRWARDDEAARRLWEVSEELVGATAGHGPE